MRTMQSFVLEESLNSVRVFWLEHEKVVEALCRTARRVGRADENVVKILLFGSLAENRGVPGSDADILIILKRADAPFMTRIEVWSEKFALDFPTELFPYTEEELTNPIAADALKKGITLFERK
jgi:predicted nucleotidyltransferase